MNLSLYISDGVRFTVLYIAALALVFTHAFIYQNGWLALSAIVLVFAATAFGNDEPQVAVELASSEGESDR
jgi:hypothetical protein